MISKDILERSEGEIVYAPMKGIAMPLCSINDPIFSQEILGKGIAIEPSDGRVVSPVDGVITMVFETRHAITLEAESGLEVLIHIGLDTVKLEGKFFQVHTHAGCKVKTGDLLAEVDLQALRNAGYKCITPIIISNTDNYSNINIIKTGEVEEMTPLLLIQQ